MKKLFGILMLLFLGGCSISEQYEPEPVIYLEITETFTSNEECAYGGTITYKGNDTNYNGVLDPAEVTAPPEVKCNWYVSLTTYTRMDESSECNGVGGLFIETGLDYNENSLLDKDEVLTTGYICDGQDGINGVDGVDGIDGISVGIRTDLYKGDDCEYGGYDIVTWSYITATGEVIEGTEKHNIICA